MSFMAPSEHAMPRLLAIDDSSLVQRLLRVRLKQERLDIHSVSTGHEGLELAFELVPEVILLDIDLPDISGFEVLHELKANPVTHDIPVIFLSGSSDINTKVRGLEMGAIDFITKPFDIAELKARVRSALQIRTLIKMLAERAHLDALTGLWNRSHFTERLEYEIQQAQQDGTPLSLVFCDIDHFKQLNDEYGHPFGDHVLVAFAQLLSECREQDIPCRYGGEEFLLITPGSTAEESAKLAERLRKRVEAMRWEEHPQLSVRASFGVTDLARAGAPTVEALVHSADRALYTAKERGRNTVAIAEYEQSELRRIA